MIGFFRRRDRTKPKATAARVMPAVAPQEVTTIVTGQEWPDITADLLDKINAEGERRLIEQHGRRTRKIRP